MSRLHESPIGDAKATELSDLFERLVLIEGASPRDMFSAFREEGLPKEDAVALCRAVYPNPQSRDLK